jgi:hypothetical protein
VSDESLEISRVGDPEKAGSTREGQKVSLIVIRADQRAGFEALDAYAADDDGPLPNYHIDALGTVSEVVDEKRAGGLVGVALWNKRRRNIDRVGISIVLEQGVDGEFTDDQISRLHQLIKKVQKKYKLDDADIVTVDPESPEGKPRIINTIPPAPGLGGDGFVLGSGGDDLWTFIYGETYKVRAGALKMNQAFPLHAAKFNLGAPLAPNDPTPVNVEGRVFNFQVFGRDLIFNEGTDYAAVVNLDSLWDEEKPEIPLAGVARGLLEASYRSALKATAAKGVALKGNQALQPGWRFHQVAKNANYGAPLSGNYVSDDGKYAVQVFAGETLYTPMTDQAGCLYLGATEPSDPAYALMWKETYKVANAPYDPNSPLQQKAAEWKVGAPLTGPYDANFGGTNYKVQVFALDTLFMGPDGQVQRFSALPKPAAVQSWAPKAPKPVPPTPPNPVPPQVPPTNAGAPRPNDINWPPRPDFNFLMDKGGAREKALGRIEWVRASGDNIKIVNNWAAEHIVDIFIPQLVNIKGGQGGKLKFHKAGADQMVRLWAAWEAAGLLHFVKEFAGTWVPRTIRRNPKALSNHAYGSAFDINVPWNGLLKVAAFVGQPGSVRELVPLANAHGFWWGGHWNYDGKGASDGMHFEWAVKR